MSTSAPLPPDDRDFLQFSGAFDLPVDPAPDFANRLRRRVTSTTVVASQPAARRRVPVSNRKRGNLNIVPAPHAGWGQTAIAVALVVILLGGAVVWTNRNAKDNGSNHLGYQTASAETRHAVNPLATASSTIDADNSSSVEAHAVAGIPPNFSIAMINDDIAYGQLYGDPVSPSAKPQAHLAAYDLSRHEQLWSQSTERLFNPSLIAGDVLLGLIYPEATVDGNGQVADPASAIPVLQARDTASGEILWTSTQLPFNRSALAQHGYAGVSDIVVVSETLYTMTGDGSLHAFDLETGALLDSTSLEQRGTPGLPPIVASDGTSIFIGELGGGVTKLSVQDDVMTEQSSIDAIDESANVVSMSVSSSYLIVEEHVGLSGNDQSARLTALTLPDFTIAWQRDLDATTSERWIAGSTFAYSSFMYDPPSRWISWIPGMNEGTTTGGIGLIDISTGDDLIKIPANDLDHYTPIANYGNGVCYVAETLQCVSITGDQFSIGGIDLGSNPDEMPVWSIQSWDGRLLISTNAGMFVTDMLPS